MSKGSGSQLGPESRVVQSTGQVAAELDGELAMMSIENGEYYVLDPVASRTWELIAQPIAVSDLCGKLMEEYEVEAETCRRDVLDFLEGMHQRGLVDLRES